MTKDERLAHANWKIMKGFAVLLFGAIWMYFTSNVYFDVWYALPPTLAVMGFLAFLLGLFKRTKV